MTNFSRRALVIGAVVGSASSAPADPRLERGHELDAKQASIMMTFAEARAAYPVTVEAASAIMTEQYRNDGPLRADDVTGTTAFADWEKANSVRFRPWQAALAYTYNENTGGFVRV